jgi:hypothetical protein
MPVLDFNDWPPAIVKDPPNPNGRAAQESRKPFDRLMPFHRIAVPDAQIILPQVRPDRNNPPKGFVPQPKIISGDGYSVGARSTHDYDGKFGEDLAKDLGDIVQNVLPPLRAANLVAQGVARGLGVLANLAGQKGAANFLDNVDPLKDLLGLAGNAIDGLLVDSFVRSVPAWVSVFDDTLHPKIQIHELDGILIRSRQRHDPVPFWQWHRWYDWHFAVCPSPIFSEMVGFGNTHRNDENALGVPKGSNLVNYYEEGQPVGVTDIANAVVECEWDLGGIGLRTMDAHKDQKGADITESRFPVFFDQVSPRKVHDRCWPQAGMFFWAIGRSVYDCSHATANNGRRVAKKDRKPQGESFPEKERLERGVHLNQLHPLKAIATARWEAFKFAENPAPVPAIQFMFYANTHLSSAGFFDKKQPGASAFSPLNDQDYEFIVDLPPSVLAPRGEYPVGRAPEFPLNTLVLAKRLLVHVDFAPFIDVAGNASLEPGVMEDADDREKNELTAATGPNPKVQFVTPKPGEEARQVTVTVPLKTTSAANNSYGMILSMGWADPSASQAARVKKVTVKIASVEPTGGTHDTTGSGEWNLNVAVNGRWFNFRFLVKDSSRVFLGPNPGPDEAKAGPAPEVELLLATDDPILVSAHGMEEDPLDDVIRKAPEFVGRPRPQKKAPELPSPPTDLDTNKLDEFQQKLAEFKKSVFERLKVLDDRLLRDATTVKVPTGKPTAQNPVPPTTDVSIPMGGDEIEWDKHIDTDDVTTASRTARAMFLRMAIGNQLDGNDPLGILDPNVPDPTHQKPPVARVNDRTDAPNPLLVSEVTVAANQVSPGVFVKKCQQTAYDTSVVGRMGTVAYDPKKIDYVLFYEVKVEDLPKG